MKSAHGKMFWYKYLDADGLEEGEAVKILSIEYILMNKILRQRIVYDNRKNRIKDTFSFKWHKRSTYESESVQNSACAWLMERYLGNKPDSLEQWLPAGARVLDTGCGSGYSSLLLFGKYLDSINYLGVDVSDAVDVTSERFGAKGRKGEFLQADLMRLPFPNSVFDMVFSEGVLHHTDSTEKSLKYLSGLLVKGGRFLFYIYKKKAPIREFADDYVREYLKDMGDEKAWDALIPLTKFGKMLGDLNIDVNIPEVIPYLEIPAGTDG